MEVAAVETVGGHFAHLGFMIKNGSVRHREIIEMWGVRFIWTYVVVEPYLKQERERIEFPEHWIYFEWLARLSHLTLSEKNPWWSSRAWRKLQERTVNLVDSENHGRVQFYPERSRAQLREPDNRSDATGTADSYED